MDINHPAITAGQDQADQLLRELKQCAIDDVTALINGAPIETLGDEAIALLDAANEDMKRAALMRAAMLLASRGVSF